MDRQWMILFIVLAITIVYPHRTDEQRKRCVLWAALAMILFSGLRSWWFGDLTKYYHGYLDASGMSIRQMYEAEGLRNIGIQVCFKIMNSLFGKLGYDYFVSLVSVFSGVTLAAVIIRFSPSPYFSFLTYICMGMFLFTYSGLKQTIAMGFCCLAMIQLLDGTFGRFLFWLLMGTLFHSPAILFLIAWPLSRKKVDFIYVMMFVAAILFVYLFRNQIAFFLENAYYSREAADELISSGENVGGRFVMMIAILIGATFFRPPNKNDIIFSRTYVVIAIAAIFQMFSVYNNNYTRLADYFFQFIMLFVPLFLEPYEYDENGERRLYGLLTNNRAIYFIAAIVITLFALWFYQNQISGLQAYRFFWEFDAHKWYGA